jgi:circadian clock protein KaiC
VETLEVQLMAEEEQKRQAVQAEDRLDMAHLRRGKPLDMKALRSKKKTKG